MKKIVLISLALVLAVGLLGVGYAMWSDTVTIGGPVTTGSLDLTIELEGSTPCDEYYWIDADGDGVIDPGELHDGEYPGYDNVPKDVGSCAAVLVDPETNPVTGKTGHQTLNITVDNAYPGYMAYTAFLLHNIGTVPLDVVLYDIAGEVEKPDGTVYDLLWGSPGAGFWQSVYEDLDRSGDITAGDPEVLNFRITNSLPVQIDPCNVEKREIDLHFKQPLQQESTYTFSVVITAEQWEE
jgi:predicted ribosomally synthesized peptide with SipW-like signal peptide